MNETKQLLQRLDGADAPDLWQDASSRIVEPSPELEDRRRRGSRLATITIALAISVVAIAALVLLFERRTEGGGEPRSAGGIPGRILFTSLIFQGQPGQIYSVDPDGSDLRQLTMGSNSYSSLSLSPDGTRIAYVRLDLEFGDNGSISGDGGEAIYVADADGSNAQAIYESQEMPQSITDLHWSPDGKSLGFILTSRPGSGSEADSNYQLMVMGTDGSDPHPISDDRITSFSWSPDGIRIAYTAESIDSTRLIDDVFTMSVDGSDRRRLTSDGVSRSPVWSPDGSLIAFDRRSELALIRPDGSAVPLRFAAEGGFIDSVEVLGWSPDSSQLLAQGVRIGKDCRLMAVRLDGTTNTLLHGPIPWPTGPGDPGSSSDAACVQSAAWSVATASPSPSSDTEPLLGPALADSLGLELQDHQPSGCQYYVEVDNPKGYCLGLRQRKQGRSFGLGRATSGSGSDGGADHVLLDR
jgi:hypothetical protein